MSHEGDHDSPGSPQRSELLPAYPQVDEDIDVLLSLPLVSQSRFVRSDRAVLVERSMKGPEVPLTAAVGR